MIDLEIIKSPDLDSIGRYKFETNQISIGQHRSNNIPVYDQMIGQKIIKILIKENKLFIYSQSKFVPIIVNKIKFQGSKNLNKNSIVSFGNTTIKINDFIHDPDLITDLESFVINTKESIAQSGPGNYSIIEEIEQSLAEIESFSNE